MMDAPMGDDAPVEGDEPLEHQEKGVVRKRWTKVVHSLARSLDLGLGMTWSKVGGVMHHPQGVLWC